jgi:small GTP-binding protein
MKEMSLTFKIILLGDANVGKTSILKRYSENIFSEEEPPTIGMAFYKKVVERKNIKITLEIWDTAG